MPSRGTAGKPRAYHETRNWLDEIETVSYPKRSINHNIVSSAKFESGPETDCNHTVAPNPYGPEGKHKLGDD